jgi:hypothetical protein
VTVIVRVPVGQLTAPSFAALSRISSRVSVSKAPAVPRVRVP